MPAPSPRTTAVSRWCRSPLVPLLTALLLVLAPVAPFAVGHATAATAAATASGEQSPPSVAAVAPHGNQSGGELRLFTGDSRLLAALDSVEEADLAHGSGELRATDEITVGETLVLSFRSERLGRAYANTSSPSRTGRLLDALNATNGTLTVTGPTRASCERLEIRPVASRSRTLVDTSSGQFRLLLDTEHLVARGGCNDELVLPGDYRVTAELPAANGTRDATVPFDLIPSSARQEWESLPVRRGPASLADDLRTTDALQGAIDRQRLLPTREIVGGEVAVVTVQSARLGQAYANASGPNATVRLLRAANATGGYARLARKGMRDEREPDSSGGVRLPGPGVRVLPDPANDTFHLVVDTGRAQLREQNGTLADVGRVGILARVVVGDEAPERYQGRLAMDEPDGAILVARNASTTGSRQVAVVGTDGRFVTRVGTNLAGGTALTLRVRAGNETLATRTVRATGDRDLDPLGGVETSVDVGEQPPGRELLLELDRDGSTVTQTRALVGPQPTLRNATVTRVGSGPGGSVVRFAVTAHYPAPGYVVVRNRSVEDDPSNRFTGIPVPGNERVRVNGTVVLPPDDEPDRLRLIAVYDANRNGEFDGPGAEGTPDQPYGTGDRGLLSVRPRMPPPTPSATVTAPPPGTTMAVTDGQAGFGFPVALCALVVAMVCARRR